MEILYVHSHTPESDKQADIVDSCHYYEFVSKDVNIDDFL